MNEAHMATQPSQTGEDPRVPGAHENARRSKGAGTPSPQGTQAPHRLTSLRGDAAFRRVRRGRPGRSRLVSVRWLPLNASEVRVGIVVSKKVGKAVVRNKVRRRLREIVRRMHLPPAEIMIIARPEAAQASFQELARDLRRALAKSGLVKG